MILDLGDPSHPREVIRVNDLLRTEFIGGIVLMSPSVYALPRVMRARALYRKTQGANFTMDDHSEGVFAYADILFHWYIGTFAGERCITLAVGREAFSQDC